MKVTYNIDGVKELKSNLRRSRLAITKAAKQAIRDEAESIMQDSLEEVPKDTGTLASAAYIETLANGDVEFGYGGPNNAINPKSGTATDDYMVAVHERLDVIHPNGKAKFLEDPLNRHLAKLETSLVGRIRRLFKF